MVNRFAPVCFIVVCFLSMAEQAFAQPKFQYESEGILVSLPSADEPKVEKFGTQSILAAAKYIEAGALSWTRDRGCVNCHTTGPYLVERSAWSKHFGDPSVEVQESFRQAVPETIASVKETVKDDHRFYPGAFTSVWRSLGLAEWDRHITKSTSEYTDRSLRDMFERQSSNGSFVSHGEVEIPHITTDFELSLQAARAISSAPGWLASPKEPILVAKVQKLKDWLQTAQPKNDFDRILRLRLAHIMPELVTHTERSKAIELLASKQHNDGGWSTRDMSETGNWHFEISEQVRKLIDGMSDASKPESDAYMTALAIVLLRQAEVPASDPRIQAGLKWLKQEQRVSGRWWMHSLYRGNYHYITYIATIEALKALDLCGELSVATSIFAREQDEGSLGEKGKRVSDTAVANGKTVKELDKAILYVFQEKDSVFWFGSDERGVYRYDGKALVNYTMAEGLVSNRIRGIQEDRAGNIYFTTYEGISRFDGRAFMTLTASSEIDPAEWKLRPDDLWFVGPPDAGLVYRFDGSVLHRLQFPRTKLGDDHLEKMPRSKFPNAIYSPYDIYCILKDSQGNVWFGSTCVGVCRFDGNNFVWFTDGTLVEAPVRSILEDKRGNFWFTYTGHNAFEGFRTIDDFGKDHKGARGTIVPGMSIVEDDEGMIWTGALGAGAFRYEGKKKTQFPIKDGDTTVSVFAIYKDNKGTVWLGTHNGGAYQFNGRTFEKF